MARLSAVAAALLLAAAGTGAAAKDETPAGPFTPKHEAGRCAIRGQCGKKSWFGKQLPCVDNDLAKDPDDDLRKELVELCGPKWETGPVCCLKDQVDELKSQLSTPNQILSSCPACKDNFYNLFCTFTCSPDQSLFINVTKTLEKTPGKVMTTELDQLISEEYGTGFYDSCRDVKFGPSNANAMDFIGGGAKNYSQMLKFLGDEKAIGSPFQINFPLEYSGEPDMSPTDMKPHKCNDEDPAFRCACVDCPAVCPELAPVQEAGSCHVGALPCLSFAAIFTYSVLLFSFIAAVAGGFLLKRHNQRRRERLRLLQDAAASEDEDDDEGDLVQNLAMLDQPQTNYPPNVWCDAAFSKLGHTAARFPSITILVSLIIVAVLSLGLFKFDIEKEPARLWVSPTSAAAQEKAFFDENFGPFYRAEQVFLVNDTNPAGPGPVLSEETLKWWIGVENRIGQIKGRKFGVPLRDVCTKPTGTACIVQSVAVYFGNDADMVDKNWRDQLRSCARSPVDCRPEYGQPINPGMILGGYDGDVADASAITVTWVLNNFEEGPELDRAMDYEEVLKDELLAVQKEAADRGLRMSFSTEISLEEELNKSTNTDAKIIVISYIVMFIYASIALGSTTLGWRDFFRNKSILLVQSKFGLGIAGIFIVLLSILASIGLFSWFGLKATLIIVDVIPFIVLAVGVDNIFLIVHEFERVNDSHPDLDVEMRISKAMGRMGPSILFSAVTETASFALGAFVGMPAVRNFAVYAAGAVFINALLQVTMFVAVLTLNQHRVEDSRMDLFPFVQLKSARIHLNGNGSFGAPRYPQEAHPESMLQQFIRKTYAPALLAKKAKIAVVAVFLGLFAAGLALLPEIQLGLDQRVAIPDDSYLIPYFNDLYDYFESGPPVFFVTREANFTQREQQQEICARFTTCKELSLASVLEQERKRPEVSYIASPTASWIDDFFQWLNPDFETCCVEGKKSCLADRSSPWSVTMSGMPEGPEFVHYLEKFLQAPTTEECPLAGQAAYGNAVVVGSQRDTVAASHFRTMHTPLRSQDDFIHAYAAARRIASDVSASTGLEVFPYSVFYIFFDQYASIVSLSLTLLGSAIAMIFVISTILLGSAPAAAVVTLTVGMAVVDIAGAMAVMGVSLNAVSLVNLIICVGIAVEFCVHIARAFMFPSKSLMARAQARFRGRDARAWTALANVGASVFSGITVTKLLGVTVLAFTRSKIFEIYYFRVWVALVFFAATHALIFLPVALSLFGGTGGYIDPESAGGLEDDLVGRRYRATIAAGGYSDESDDE